VESEDDVGSCTLNVYTKKEVEVGHLKGTTKDRMLNVSKPLLLLLYLPLRGSVRVRGVIKRR
jgi:hypothetical protein